MELAEVAGDFVMSSSASPTSSAARSCSVVAAVDFAFASVTEGVAVVPAGTLAAAVTPVSEAAAVLAWAPSEVITGVCAALTAVAGGDAMYCDSSAMVAAMALGSVLPLPSGVSESSVVGFASADFAGAALAVLGSALAPAPVCASSCRKFGALPPGACVAVDPPEMSVLADAADPAVPPAPLPPPAPLRTERDRPPAPLGVGALLDVAVPLEGDVPLDDGASPLEDGVPLAEGALLDEGAALDDGVPLERGAPLEAAAVLAVPVAPLDPAAPTAEEVPEPVLGAAPPSRLAMPPLEPREREAGPFEAAVEDETDSRPTAMHSVRWAAL